MNNISVNIKNVYKRFGDFIAVNNIDLSVNKGEIFGFLGPNGAGKSTTIKMLTGLLIPSSGKISVNGLDVYTQTEEIRKNIGYMSQKFSLYSDLTVIENINFYAGLYNIKKSIRKERIDWVIKTANIKDQLYTITDDLSLGIKQRLALACSIINKPDIIFLDEPTSGVDPVSRRAFWDLIHELAHEKKTIFVTTHYMDEADYCDRLALIFKGKMIAQGTPDQLKKKISSKIVFELISQDSILLMKTLKELEPEKEMFYYGQGVHIIIKDSSEKDIIIKKLQNKNITLINSGFVEPSLENVFVSLINMEKNNEL